MTTDNGVRDERKVPRATVLIHARGVIVAAVCLAVSLLALEGAVLVNDAYCASLERPAYGCPLDVVNRWMVAIEPRCAP